MGAPPVHGFAQVCDLGPQLDADWSDDRRVGRTANGAKRACLLCVDTGGEYKELKLDEAPFVTVSAV